ncbi:MAG: hypothetical protein O3B01_29295 [Planctomycetota bacterium]|nr:hypothetical protein [Planctomycetota bacterium]MDA1142679.1 hypothetical protein [Planctomycetota bacterium]
MSLNYSPKIITPFKARKSWAEEESPAREAKAEVFVLLEAAEQEVALLEEQATGLTVLVRAAATPELAQKARSSLEKVQERISDITEEIRELASALKELQELKAAVLKEADDAIKEAEAMPPPPATKWLPSPEGRSALGGAQPQEAGNAESLVPAGGSSASQRIPIPVYPPPVPIGREVPQRWAQRDRVPHGEESQEVPEPDETGAQKVATKAELIKPPQDVKATSGNITSTPSANESAAPPEDSADQEEERAPSLMSTQIRKTIASYKDAKEKPPTSFATLEMDLQGIEWIPCKQCKKKFPDSGTMDFVKECPHCGYRFYANLTYEMRAVETREKRRAGRRNRKQFTKKMVRIGRTPVTRQLEPIYNKQLPKLRIMDWVRQLIDGPLQRIGRWRNAG